MTMEWFHGKRWSRDPGTPGVYVILADASGSMHEIMRNLEKATRDALRSIPGSRAFLWAEWTTEFQQRDKFEANVGGYTHLAQAIRAIEPLRPEKTIVISDGMPDDVATALQESDRLTGAIDTLLLYRANGSWHGASREFMEALARRSGGRFHQGSDSDSWSEIGRQIQKSAPTSQPIAEELPMEYRLKSGRVDVQAPPNQVVYVPEVIEIQRQRVFKETRLEDKWIKEAAPDEPVLITAESSTITTHENTQVIEHRGLLKSLLFGPARRSAELPAPAEQFRGALHSSSATPTLAAPTAEPLLVEYQPVEALSGSRLLVKALRGR
jgi:hypothetical protein